MKPKIDETQFGSITIAGENYTHDIFIRWDGQIKKRKKKLSKAVYGTSHILSLDEAKDLYEPGAELLVFGTGQVGMARLSEEAAVFFDEKICKVSCLPTPEAIEVWNRMKGKVIGLFHVTC